MRTELGGRILRDMEGRIESGHGTDEGLAQTATAKESDEGNGPYRRVHRVGHAEGALQREEVVDGNGDTRKALVHDALLICGDPDLLDPIVITHPRSIVVQMPGPQARKPRADGATSDLRDVLADESADEAVGGRHARLLTNPVCVTELRETQGARRVISRATLGEAPPHSQKGLRREGTGELGFEFSPVTFGVGSTPGVNAIGGRDMGAKAAFLDSASVLRAPGLDDTGPEGWNDGGRLHWMRKRQRERGRRRRERQ